MKIAIPKEGYGETRVAASPEVVKKLVALGFSVTIEKNAGIPSSFTSIIDGWSGLIFSFNLRSTTFLQ